MSGFHLVDRNLAPPARPLVATALVAGSVLAAGIVMFIAGEMMTDPGGWTGLGFVAAWLVPPLIVTVLAVLRPIWGTAVLAACVGLLIIASAATWIYPDQIRAFEDSHGPVLLVAAIAVWLPVIALGRARPLAAGILLLTATVGPILLQAGSLVLQGTAMIVVALAVVSTPFVLLGLLLLAAGIINAKADQSA